jgi:hypothetical protein
VLGPPSVTLLFVSEQEQDEAQERMKREREQRKKKEQEDSMTLEQTKEQVGANVSISLQGL